MPLDSGHSADPAADALPTFALVTRQTTHRWSLWSVATMMAAEGHDQTTIDRRVVELAETLRKGRARWYQRAFVQEAKERLAAIDARRQQSAPLDRVIKGDFEDRDL